MQIGSARGDGPDQQEIAEQVFLSYRTVESQPTPGVFVAWGDLEDAVSVTYTSMSHGLNR
jgi:hypothetical protein